MVSSSTRRWLGSATLAGLLLASSIPALATTPLKTTTGPSPMKPLLVASTNAPKETYSQAVRKQMQWVVSPVNANTSVESVPVSVKSVPEPSKPVVVQKKAEPAQSKQKTVQVATVPKKPVSRSDSSTLVNNALSLIGVPYVFGGTSRSGFDCSGYTQYVFKGSGISLPRTSYEQFNIGSSIKNDQLQPGDLVFFTTYAKGPSHVGIYVGGGNFVHASNTGVRTTSLSDSYYAGRYLGARRVN